MHNYMYDKTRINKLLLLIKKFYDFKPTSKVRGLSIEPRSSTGCIDACI